MKNIKLIIAYDGSHFFGWQITATGPSVEETLQKTLQNVLQENVCLQAASRTDRGVHAEGQVVNFVTHQVTLNLQKLTKSLNALLPQTVQVISAEEMALSFHPTLDATGKQYAYTLCFGPFQLPKYRMYSWHLPVQLNREAMQKASSMLCGLHDFSAFYNQRKNLSYTDKTRDIFEIIFLSEVENQLQILISGNHFLYKMVRTIVGTLVYVGKGKIPLSEIPMILTAKKRSH